MGTRNTKLTQAMREAVSTLDLRGSIGKSDGIGSSTIVALMQRGIIREAGYASGHRHFPATTPEQVRDEADAEEARRNAEIQAYAADSTNWIQTNPDGDLDAHTRQTRDGRTILIVGLRHWRVYVGDVMQFSTAGDWAEVRRTADNFERNQAYGAAADEDEARSVAQGRELLGWGQPDGMLGTPEAQMPMDALSERLHAVALEENGRRAHARVVNLGVTTPAKPAEIAAAYADLDRARSAAEHVNTPAEARTGISNRTTAALADVAELRQWVADRSVSRNFYRPLLERLDRIEAALRGTS